MLFLLSLTLILINSLSTSCSSHSNPDLRVPMEPGLPRTSSGSSSSSSTPSSQGGSSERNRVGGEKPSESLSEITYVHNHRRYFLILDMHYTVIARGLKYHHASYWELSVLVIQYYSVLSTIKKHLADDNVHFCLN